MAVRAIDTQPPVRTRRTHSLEFKRQIVQASLAPNASSAQIAMAHGINPNQLHAWRRQLQCGELGEPGETAALIPVQLPVAIQEPLAESARPVAPKIPEPTRQREGYIDIWVGDAQVRVHGAVNGESLRCVLEALRG